MSYSRWIEDDMMTNLGPCGIDSRTGEHSGTPGGPGFSLPGSGRGLAYDSHDLHQEWKLELLDSWMAIIYLPCYLDSGLCTLAYFFFLSWISDTRQNVSWDTSLDYHVVIKTMVLWKSNGCYNYLCEL